MKIFGDLYALFALLNNNTTHPHSNPNMLHIHAPPARAQRMEKN
jgi:hypothetical protein